MTGFLPLAAGLGAVVLVATALLLKPLVAWLRHRAVLDVPNHRSSHRVPTPRGGGLAVSAAVLAGWTGVLAWSGGVGPFALALLLAGLGLAVLSWLDDMRDLPRRLRFFGHVAAVAVAVALLPGDLSVSQGLLPAWVERPLLVLAWVWFTNLYNFMDGIDGITGVETAHLGLGVAVVAAATGAAALWPLAPLGAVAAGAALGFLLWNWHPAKVFLGDVGSVPLGFLLGGLLVVLAASGAWAAALILPAYYLCDATLTLLSRMARGHSPVEAHREHAYQKAVARGLGHDVVVRRIALGNAALLAAAVVAELVSPPGGLVLAAGVVAVLMRSLCRGPLATAPKEEVQPR